MRANGGVGALRDQLEALGRTIGDCAEIASQAAGALDDEAASEARLQQTHGEKWELLSSGGDEMVRLRAELTRHEGSLAAHVESQLRLRSDVDASASELQNLDLPAEVIVSRMPHAGGSPLSQLPCTLELRRALDALDARAAVREEIFARACALGRRAVTLSFDCGGGGGAAAAAAPFAGVSCLQDNTQLGFGVVVSELIPSSDGRPTSGTTTGTSGGTPFERAGLQPGDLLLRIGGKVPSGVAHAVRLLQEATGRIGQRRR